MRTLKETFHSSPKVSNTTGIWNNALNKQNLTEITLTQELCAEQSDKNDILISKQIALVCAGLNNCPSAFIQNLIFMKILDEKQGNSYNKFNESMFKTSFYSYILKFPSFFNVQR